MDRKDCVKIVGVIVLVALVGLLVVWMVRDPMSVEGRGLISTSSSNSPPTEDTAIHHAFVQNIGKPLASTSLWFRYFIRENPQWYGNGSVLPDSVLFPGLNATTTTSTNSNLEAVETPVEEGVTEILKRSKRFLPLFIIPSLIPVIRLRQFALQTTTPAPAEPSRTEENLKTMPALFRHLKLE
jgi:hypothetical protein